MALDAVHLRLNETSNILKVPVYTYNHENINDDPYYYRHRTEFTIKDEPDLKVVLRVDFLQRKGDCFYSGFKAVALYTILLNDQILFQNCSSDVWDKGIDFWARRKLQSVIMFG